MKTAIKVIASTLVLTLALVGCKGGREKPTFDWNASVPANATIVYERGDHVNTMAVRTLLISGCLFTENWDEDNGWVLMDQGGIFATTPAITCPSTPE